MSKKDLMFFPKYMLDAYGSRRAFKQAKRKQIRDLRKAIIELRSGCAYMPKGAYEAIKLINSEVDYITSEASLKKWGR